MSLYGMMRTGVSGMAAQSSLLSGVADNIANSGTTGYKRAQTEFSTLVLPGTTGSYNSGGVSSTTVRSISDQGNLQYTTSNTDLAVNGGGFFIVQDASGSPVLTRAGSFTPDGDGHLVNAAGFQLLGYSYANGTPTATANGFAGLVPVTISQSGLSATPSTTGTLTTNLPSDAAIVAAANLPSANGATAAYTAKTSLVTYDDTGAEKLLDVYYTKTADNTWEVSVFDNSQASPNTSFPYSSGPLATQTLTFDPTTGQLATGSATSISVPVPGGKTADIDLTGTSQLASDFTIFNAVVNGSAPSSIEQIQIAKDGTLYAQNADGSLTALYKIPLATVPSPDNLMAEPGNVYTQSTTSGDVQIGFANEAGMGSINSGALENSDVDIATELTDMIQSQRSYTADSKVFQTGSDLMDVVLSLYR